MLNDMNVKDLAPFGVRLQPSLRAWIKENAKRNQRSMNNEIVFILEQARSATNTTSLNELTTTSI